LARDRALTVLVLLDLISDFAFDDGAATARPTCAEEFRRDARRRLEALDAAWFVQDGRA
jgi:hypothetical protein